MHAGSYASLVGSRLVARVAGAKRGGGGGRENPPPLFPFLPLPSPLPLSTPATQANVYRK